MDGRRVNSQTGGGGQFSSTTHLKTGQFSFSSISRWDYNVVALTVNIVFFFLSGQLWITLKVIQHSRCR